MVTLQEQVATQLNNIKGNTGLTPERTAELARSSRLEKHGEIVALLKSEYGLTIGDMPLPNSRSPSQWPGTARSCASAGR